MVRIRDFSGEVGGGKKRLTTTESDYFEKHARLSWSMAIQGIALAEPLPVVVLAYSDVDVALLRREIQA